MTATIAERVAAGAAFLDVTDPDWWRADVDRAIDLSTLDLGLAGACVLGQRCPLEIYNSGLVGDTKYVAMAKHLSGFHRSGDADRWAGARGFQVSYYVADGDDDIEYADLTAEWKRVITERRSA